MEYGDVEASPEEVVILQERMGSDIAVSLDVPTGLTSKEKAEETVKQTLANLETTLKVLDELGERRALWAAPIQGGVHLDLLKWCAEKEAEMGFDLYALGSPTLLMEGYRFDKLFQMLITAKSAVGPGKPLHLFGAGHPMMFPFAVALGADMFDSASYYLYARDGRYITSTGTLRVERLDYLPCECPVCSETSAEELREAPREERVKLLAKHNLYVCFREVWEIRQAIRDGRLMELLEVRARAHPSLYQGFRELMAHEEALRLMEAHTPLSSRRGVNLYDGLSLRRPRVRRARRRLMERYYKARGAETMVLIPATRQVGVERLRRLVGTEEFDAALYGTPFGLIPYELRYVYPFSQTNYPRSLIEDELEDLVELSIQQLRGRAPKRLLLWEPRAQHLRVFVEKLLNRLEEEGLEAELIPEKGGGQPLSRPRGRDARRGEDEAGG